MQIRCRAPLRLGLAGGGTDIATFSDKYGGYVLNATIDRYVYVTIQTGDGQVEFESGDLGRRESLPLANHFPLDSGLALHRAVYNHFIENYNSGRPQSLYVHTLAEAPAGSGLGTSSTIVVALCHAFCEYFNVAMDEYQIAELAYNIERHECALAGGKQDQYTAAFGGVNFMEFMQSGRVLVNPLRVKKWILTEFESSLLLYFTGVSRDSDRIIRSQNENVRQESRDAIDAMLELKQEAVNMKNSLLTGDFDSLITSFQKGWESKKRSASCISNPGIERLYSAAMEAGALAAKISGAGGGGFMMFIVPPHKRSNLMKVLREAGGEIFPAHFTKSGVTSWRIAG